MKSALQLLQDDAALLFESGVCIDIDVLGRIKRELFWTIGEHRALGFMARLGVSLGQKDAREKKPDVISNRGLMTTVRKTKESHSREIIYESHNSLEAQAYLTFFPPTGKQCQCWLLAGYLSGWCSINSNESIIVIETQCLTKGDALCQFKGKPLSEWDGSVEEDLSFYREDNMAEELASTREQLRLTRDRYQTLFEQSSVPIFILEPETGVFLDVNVTSEDLVGYSRQQLATMTMFDLIHPKDHNRLMEDLKEITTGHSNTEVEMTLVRKDGSERIVLVSSKMLTFGGQPVIQRVLRDITDLKTAEQKERYLEHQLQRSERLSSIGRLAAGVAHEIKNPLGAIKNAVYYIRKALDNTSILEADPHLQEILKLSEEEVDSAVTIIQELLDFSQVVHITPKLTSINELLESLPNIISLPQNVELIWDLDLTLPSTFVDPHRLRQVFCNIMTNAIQAMPNGGTLTISSRLDIISSANPELKTQMVSIGFEDTGLGIDAAHLAKIFEPLYTTKARGTGLGLAISSNIVEKHGGRIEVSSKKGKGTNFTVHVPLQAPLEKEGSSHDVK